MVKDSRDIILVPGTKSDDTFPVGQFCIDGNATSYRLDRLHTLAEFFFIYEKKLFCNFIEITLWHRCSPVNLLHIFRTPFSKNTSGWLLLE